MALDLNPRRIGGLRRFWMGGLILALLIGMVQLAQAAGPYTVVTPANPDGWHSDNVRANATVGITTAQPRGAAPNNLGSLEFTTNTIVSGQDKADYVKYWGLVSGRTLGNLSALSYELYRAASSTTAQHFVPAFRLAYATPGGQTGYLIWENVYNGGSTSTPVPTDQWLSKDIFAGNFWMREFGPGATIQNYGVTLAEWQANDDDGTGTIAGQPGDPAPHVLGPDTNIIGIEIGVGSGWGNAFTGYIDNVAASFGADSVTANFEPDAVVVQCTTDCYVDDDTGNDSNGGTSFADAKQHIQAGINQVSSGGTVHVKDGTYNEDLLITKPLTLEGVQHGVLAKNRPGAQAIVKALSSGNPVDIQADNVTIDGFVFDGSAATNSPWIITALSGPGNGRYENITILNNEFKGNPGNGTFPGGMYLYNHDDPKIEGNYFNALGQHAVFLAGTSTNAIYRNNDSYRNYNSNISTQDMGAGHSNVLIENNRAVEDDMILFNMHNSTVRNNTITGGAYSTSRIWLGGGNSNVLITGNSFASLQSTAVQILDIFGYGSNSNLTITGNTINTTVAFQNDNYSLIDFRDGSGSNLVDSNKVTLSGSYAAGGSATYAVGVRGSAIGTVTITNNEFDGGNVSNTGTPPSSAVLIRSNSASGALPASAVIKVANNYLKNFSNGLVVYDFVANSYGGLPNGVALSVNKNSITGNSANGVITSASGPLLNAENNWWGSNTGPAAVGNPSGTGDKATGSVDYDPWLCSGTDNQPGTTGFQTSSTSSPCTAPSGTLAVTKYNDLNRNHAKDANESGLSGWTITVKQGATTITSGTTDGNGNITFTTLTVGSYTVCETLKSGWQNTDPSDGSGCKPATVTANSTTNVLLGNASTDGTGTLKVAKYNDLNRNGKRDSGEAGLSGWTITVKQGTATVASGTTNASGEIAFTLLPASYKVCETQQVNWQNTDPSDASGCKTVSVKKGSIASVVLGNAPAPANPAPAQLGKIYAVNDGGLADSQFFTINLSSPNTVTALGPLYKDYDLEGLDIDPRTGIIYATSGGDNKFNQKAWLYKVDGLTGALTPIGGTGQKEVESLAFAPDGTLWGWGIGKGLIKINLATGASTLVLKDSKDVEGLAFSNDGSLVYASSGKKLYVYTVSTGKLTELASNLPGSTEALETRPDGKLLLGVDGSKVIYVYDPITKQVTAEKINVAPYSDVEGIGYSPS